MSSFVIDAFFYDGEQTENIRVEIGEELSAPKVSELSQSKDVSQRGCDKRVGFAELSGSEVSVLEASVPEASNPKVSDPTATKSSFVVNTCFYNGEETETIRVKFGDELCGRELPVTKVSDPKVTHPEVEPLRQKRVQTETIRVEFGDEVSDRKVSVPPKSCVPELSQPEFATRNCYRKRIAPAHSAPQEGESRTLCRRIVAPAPSAPLGEGFSLLIIIVVFFILLFSYAYLMTLSYGLPQARRPRVHMPPVQVKEYYHRLELF